MLWPVASLLAFVAAVQAASSDANVRTCPRIDGPLELCLVDIPAPAASLVVGEHDPINGPTAAPTYRPSTASRRTASAGSPASTSTSSATNSTAVEGKHSSAFSASAVPEAVSENSTTTAGSATRGGSAKDDLRIVSQVAGDDGDGAISSVSKPDNVTARDGSEIGNTPVEILHGSVQRTAESTDERIGNTSEASIAAVHQGGRVESTSLVDIMETTVIPQPSEATNAVKHSSETVSDSDSSNMSNTSTTLPDKTAPSSSPQTPKSPSKHKYNYASPDCGARVHSSSPSSQHASGVLHKSRDRYMLTPCKADQHWVTIELCDEIRVEAVEVSVWEYFSGVVREVKVSIGGDDEGEGEGEGDGDGGMQEVGIFVGKNTYTLQKPTSFSRFVRIDFPSHYGSEYYCPVSHIKVYGLNQLEAYKWEQKQKVSSSTTAAAVQSTSSASALDRSTNTNDTRHVADMGELEKLVHAAAHTARDPLPSTKELLGGQNTSTSDPNTPDHQKPRRDRSDSESIYAFITRRLADLEGNSTLVLRYIDEQTRILRRTQQDMYEWRREQEINDAQRWESERMRQEDRLGRIISQLEAQRSDRLVLDAKLRVLEEQLSHERRRGFAQIGVLMMVIAIGAATRSDTIERLMKPILAEAGRRKRRFTFSADLGKKRANSGPTMGIVGMPDEWRDEAVNGEKDTEKFTPSGGMSRSNSMGFKRANGGMPSSIRKRGHRPDHHHAPRSSLPLRNTPRKLARTSHLHPLLGQAVGQSDATESVQGSPYAESPLSPLGASL